MSTYFITGATGTIGKEVVNSLLSKNEHVIAGTRDPQKLQDFYKDSVTGTYFDYGAKESYQEVLNTDGIFLLGPPLNPGLYELLEPFVDYLQDNYKGRLIYLSGNGMENLEELPFHKKMEEKLKNSSLNWNIVRPGFFMQNFGNYDRENIQDRNIIFSPAGEGKSSFVSSKDVGSAIAELLIDPNRVKETHVLTGTKAYTHFDVAAMLSDILRREITYPNPDENTYKQVLKESGAPDFIADYMIPVYGMIKQGKVDNVTTAIKDLTGKEPESLEEVLKRDFQ
ncbi:NAD(P)H-binding protein [Aquimarina litoralis]|uniref:NmrA family NAD(P)-binding protein n=1 Tax=Aquimarina litoralis TaxID=584605 RepID=UPI001C57E547|nr:NAD(P)H-binding protein [Aquimarina litoralis]MBW1298939.1 NAD(P)H-binding protein [Aquimarina litoralis]